MNRVQQLEHMLGEWKQMRFEIMNAMTAPSGELVDLRGTPQRTKLAGSMISGLSNVEIAYVKELKDYNKHVLYNISRPNLFSCFTKAAESLNDKKIVDMWQMVKYMVDVPSTLRDEQTQPRSNPITEQRIIVQARKYLEDRYRDFMNSVVNENLAQAKRGGVPGTLPLVKSFVGIKVQNLRDLEDVVVEGKPLWPLVYYCMRSGDFNAALQCLNMCGNAYQEFRTALKEATSEQQRRPGSRSESVLKLHYRKHVRSTTDPFKKAAYNALVPCEPDDLHSEVMFTADDYLWLKLCQVRDNQDSEQKLTLAHLQTTILEVYGKIIITSINFCFQLTLSNNKSQSTNFQFAKQQTFSLQTNKILICKICLIFKFKQQ